MRRCAIRKIFSPIAIAPYCIVAAIAMMFFTGALCAQDTLVYSFEDGPEGFAPNGGVFPVEQDTIGSTEGSHSLKVAVPGPATFVGALTGSLPPAIGDPPGLDHVLFDLTLTEPFPDPGFAVIGVMIFGVAQDGTAVQIQTGPSVDPELEFPIGALEPGTYRDIRIDMTQFSFHPVTFELGPLTFNDIIGTQGSGPNDMIPTGFQLYINKTGSASHPLTVYFDNIRVGITPEAVPGDYNANGTVDAADYTIWRDNLGLTGGATAAEGDGTGDGNVMDDDYTFWKERFGNIAGSGALSAVGVPEPASALLVMIAGASCFWGRRGRVGL